MQGYAQTVIGATTTHASAKLDVSSTNKGFLPPRVTLTAATDVATFPGPAEELLVYNVGSAGLQMGYHYCNKANWTTIVIGTSAGNSGDANDLEKLFGETYSIASGKLSYLSRIRLTMQLLPIVVYAT
jgi:hypothetical protein